jgi:hypothetical protein
MHHVQSITQENAIYFGQYKRISTAKWHRAWNLQKLDIIEDWRRNRRLPGPKRVEDN